MLPVEDSDLCKMDSPFNENAMKDMFLSFQQIPGWNHSMTFPTHPSSNQWWHMPLNVITNGPGVGQRVGNTIRLIGFEFAFSSTLENIIVTGGFSRQMRILLVKSPSGTLPQIDDILISNPELGSLYEVENVPSLYQILYDFTLPPQFLDGLALSKGEYWYKGFPMNHIVRFPTTGQTPTSENIDNNVFFLFCSNSNATYVNCSMRAHYVQC